MGAASLGLFNIFLFNPDDNGVHFASRCPSCRLASAARGCASTYVPIVRFFPRRCFIYLIQSRQTNTGVRNADVQFRRYVELASRVMYVPRKYFVTCATGESAGNPRSIIA